MVARALVSASFLRLMSNLVLGRELREEDEIRVLIGAAGDAREMVKSCSHLRKNFR
jgi:hypothetical protein